MSIRSLLNYPFQRLIYFTPLMTTLFVMGTYYTFYRIFLQCPDKSYKCNLINLKLIFNDIRPEFASSAEGYVDRVTWTLAGGLHLMVSVAAILVSGFIIYQALNRHRVRDRLMLIFVTTFVAADLGFYGAILTSADVSSPAQLMMEKTAARALPHINFYNRIFDALGLMVGVVLAVAACTILWHDGRGAQDENELVRRLRLLRVLLYAGAAALIIGVLRLASSLNWGGDFWVGGSPAGKETSELITGILSSLGISYTLLLASVYVPTAIVLRARAESLAKAAPPDKQKEWLENHGLTLSYLGYLPRILALLGPILVGPIGQLLSRLGTLAAGSE